MDRVSLNILLETLFQSRVGMCQIEAPICGNRHGKYTFTQATLFFFWGGVPINQPQRGTEPQKRHAREADLPHAVRVFFCPALAAFSGLWVPEVLKLWAGFVSTRARTEVRSTCCLKMEA